MLPLHYRRHDASQETRQWLLAIAPLPFLLALSQTTQRCSQTSDNEGIQTPAGGAQWISGPSPWPLGHTVMLVTASHIQHKVCTSRPHGHLSQHLRAHCQNSPSCATSKHICMTKCLCTSRVTSMATMHSATRPLMLLQLLARAWHHCCHPIPHPCGFASVLKISNDSEGIRTPAGRAQWISGPSP